MSPQQFKMAPNQGTLGQVTPVESIFNNSNTTKALAFNRSGRVNTRVDFLFSGPVVQNVG